MFPWVPLSSKAVRNTLPWLQKHRYLTIFQFILKIYSNMYLFLVCLYFVMKSCLDSYSYNSHFIKIHNIYFMTDAFWSSLTFCTSPVDFNTLLTLKFLYMFRAYNLRSYLYIYDCVTFLILTL